MNQAVIALALVAGGVAAFNPCGFALLPAYLGLLAAEESTGGRASMTLRAVRFAAGMTVGFVGVFGLAGLALSTLALSIEPYLPVVTVLIGVVLVGLGGWLLAGRHLAIPGLAGHGRAPTRSWWTQIGYGVSFALASLSCTVGPFLAVTASSLGSAGTLGVVGAFLAYALGMGTVVLALSLAVVAARGSVVRAMRRAGSAIGRVSGALLLVAGAYVAWYGWFEIRVLSGRATSDPIISAALSVQAAVSRWVAGLGAGGLLLLALGTGLLLAGLVLARRAAVASTGENSAGGERGDRAARR